MRTVICFLCAAISTMAVDDKASQTIDAGRGPVPVVVPSGYDKAKPAPLVVLLHGYTGSGSQQDSYMKFGALANTYGYLFIAPDGTRED